ncbi:hypothetical protein BJV77DRAFT_1005856 [Russula vinacea]|nr:hypothetical protein BJV77DRAFT_1005856 [Russula vinacea]
MTLFAYWLSVVNRFRLSFHSMVGFLLLSWSSFSKRAALCSRLSSLASTLLIRWFRSVLLCKVLRCVTTLTTNSSCIIL